MAGLCYPVPFRRVETAAPQVRAVQVTWYAETRFLNADSSGELEHIKTEIIARLNQGDAATLQWTQRALGSSEPRTQRHLIDVLGQTESSEALEALLQFAQAAEAGKGDPRMPALRAIAGLKRLEKASEQSRDAASAVLEQYLENGSDDTETLYAVASGISKLGRPEGISKLIGLLETKPQTTGIISGALNKARSPAAISLLKDRLLQDPELSNPASNIIGSTLGAIGTPQAVKALLALASKARSEETRQMIFSWLSQIHDERSIQLLYSAEDDYRFADPQFGLQLQELGQQIDNGPLAPVPLLAGMPELSDSAVAPPEMTDGMESFSQ